MLAKTIAALEAQPDQPRALLWLRTLSLNKAWQACSEYRHRWTHNSRPAVVGLGCILTSKRLEVTGDSVGFGFGTKQPVDWTIEQLRPTFRKGYSALLRVYLDVMKLMSPDRKSLRAAEPMRNPRRAAPHRFERSHI